MQVRLQADNVVDKYVMIFMGTQYENFNILYLSITTKSKIMAGVACSYPIPNLRHYLGKYCARVFGPQLSEHYNTFSLFLSIDRWHKIVS